jgi:hypothetical protein
VRTADLILSDEQLAIIRRAAATVPASWRGRFLANVADRLTLVPKLRNVDVLTACGAVRRSMLLGIGPVALGADE